MPRRPIRILLAALAVAAMLGAIEVSARLLGLQNGLSPIMTERDCMQRSALLGFELRPNCEVVRGKGITYRVNSQGLRSPELYGDTTPRILALGDSCTWGWGVKQDESYPSVLQRALDTRYRARRYEVINAGRPAWTSHQGRVWLAEHGIAFGPAIVILGFGFHDATPGGDDEERIRAQAKWHSLFRADDFVLDRWHFYSWLRWRFVAAPNAAPRVSPEKYRRNMNVMIDLARENGAQVLLLAFPATKPDLSEYLAALEEIRRERRVPLVTYQGPRFDPVHPTAEGYRRLGGQLVARLAAEGYLPPRTGTIKDHRVRSNDAP